MRSLPVATLHLPTLRESGKGGQQAAQHRQQKATNPSASLSFPEHWSEPDVRGALYARHGRVCAYCGRSLPDNDKGDVEHFRPKGKVVEDTTHGGYWWLAYVFANYLMSCSVCNRVRKRDRFPLRPAARRRITYQTRQRLPQEARLLVHPSDVEPRCGPIEQWLCVDWQAPNCRIQPQEHLLPTLHVQVTGTLEFFKINRTPRLLRERNVMRDKVLEALDRGDEAQAKQYASRFQAHSLVARQILLDQQRLDLLPTPGEELQWFLAEELQLLEITLALLDQTPNDESLRQTAQEQRWMFAALWHQPPLGTSSDVERWLPEPLKVHLQPFVACLT